jgi:hypothetical protein
MIGRQTGDQSQLFYLFNLERRIPERNLLRRINPIVTRILAGFREKLEPFYSEIGRPSIESCARRSSCTSPTAGSAASTLTTGLPITRLSRSIATVDSATAFCSAKYSKQL